jgi:hypothetical protein
VIQLYLTRRNLKTLLTKLDDPDSKRTIIKNDVEHPKYPNSHTRIFVTAVDDADYYKDRAPGRMKEDG